MPVSPASSQICPFFPLIHNVGAVVPEDTWLPRLPGQLASGQIQPMGGTPWRETGRWMERRIQSIPPVCPSASRRGCTSSILPVPAGLPFPGWHLLARSFNQGSIPTRWPWPWALGTPPPALACQPQLLLTSVLLHHLCLARRQS